MCGTNNQAVSVGQGRKSGQWMRKSHSMDEKKWATDQTTAAFLSIEVQPGLRYMQAILMDGWTEKSETMLSSRHYPGGRISQAPRVTGLAPFFPILHWPRSSIWESQTVCRAESCQSVSKKVCIVCMCMYDYIDQTIKNFPMEASVIIYDYNHCRLSIIHRLHSFKTPATVIIIVLRGGWVMSLLGRKTKALVVWTNHWF